MTDRITLTGIEVFAHHGVLESERVEGQPFTIDVEVDIDLSAAAASDDLANTLDYGELAKRVHEAATQRRYLIEAVAGRVADAVMDDPRVSSTRVTVHKPRAPISVPFADVSVTLERHR